MASNRRRSQATGLLPSALGPSKPGETIVMVSNVGLGPCLARSSATTRCQRLAQSRWEQMPLYLSPYGLFIPVHQSYSLIYIISTQTGGNLDEKESQASSVRAMARLASSAPRLGCNL